MGKSLHCSRDYRSAKPRWKWEGEIIYSPVAGAFLVGSIGGGGSGADVGERRTEGGMRQASAVPPEPTGGNTADALFAWAELKPGWNEGLFERVRGTDAPPLQCHVTFSGDGQCDALPDLGRTRLPWEA